MKDDRDGKWFGGVSAPRKKTDVEGEQRFLFDYIHSVRNRARELPKVGVEVPVGGSDIQCTVLHVCDRGETRVANYTGFGVSREDGSSDRRGEGPKEDDDSARMHNCMVRGVVSNIGSLCQVSLGE
jgi:hypothetical protein